MTKTTEFVAELIRAANEVERLAPLERRGLLERAVSTVRALRDYLEGRGKVAPIERGIGKELQQLSAMLHNIPMRLSPTPCCKPLTKSGGYASWFRKSGSSEVHLMTSERDAPF